MTFWSAHTHSRYSAKDALPTVEKVVAKAAQLGYPALGLTDHGNMGGAAQLYSASRKAGIKPLPGIEAYVALDRSTDARKTMHLGMLALTPVGYRNLVGLATQSAKQFHYKPVLDLPDLAAAGEDGRLEGIACMSGCWFGLLPTMIRTGSPLAVRNLLVSLDGWFGEGLYVELQHHRIRDDEHDDTLHVALLHQVATDLGLPVVITQDSHYCEADDKPVHETMKRLMSWSDDADDAVFPGDGYQMVQEDWMALRYSPTQLGDGLAGLADLEAKARVVIPELDDFQLAVPDLGGDPDVELRKDVVAGYNARLTTGAIKQARKDLYTERIEEEMRIITSAGFSGYLQVAGAVCDYMREHDIMFNIRGSASGSLVLFLKGITSLDPILMGLPFDRFLSSDRTKPPDIDIDVEHRRRDEVIAWMESRWHVEHIGTWLQMGLNPDESDQKGSLMVRWKMNQRKMGNDPDLRLNSRAWAELKAVADEQPYLGYGVHAAGLLVTPDAFTAACVPMSYVASSKTLVTSFGKKDVERMGLVKLDLLGLKTLTAVKTAYTLAGIGPSNIVWNDSRSYALMRSGRTTGLFQLEGGATARGCMQLEPRKLTDVIAAMALFRPATLESGATESFVKRRKGEEKIQERHPIIMEETAETYGILLYQEQALGVMKRLGLTTEEIEAARDAIKASNANVGGARQVLEGLRTKIRAGALAAGFVPADIAWLDGALDAYAGYGFNKAHAAAYGVLAYTTAWLRTNYPVAFWAGMLDAYADSQTEVWYGPRGQRARIPQIQAYRSEAQKDGVVLLGPHVNHSKVSWSADPKLVAVRAGLTSLKGVGQVAAKELVAHQPYADLSDLVGKVSTKRVSGVKDLALGHTPSSCPGVIGTLAHAGALRDLAPVPPPPPKAPRKKAS